MKKRKKKERKNSWKKTGADMNERIKKGIQKEETKKKMKNTERKKQKKERLMLICPERKKEIMTEIKKERN